MKFLPALVLLLFLAPSLLAKDDDASNRRPVAWGILSHNKGCVIFGEGHKTTGMFWGVAITTKTVGKLTVIETQNYTLDESVILETDDKMDDLMVRAQTDHIKFVKIPEKYTDYQIKRARDLCKSDQ